VIKYRDAKRRTLEAFNALKMGNVEIEELGLSIAPGNSAEAMQNMMRGMAVETGKSQIELASTTLVRLKGIDTMTASRLPKLWANYWTSPRILARTSDPVRRNEHGLPLWPPGTRGFVRFVLTDVSKIREQAYEKAVEDAALGDSTGQAQRCAIGERAFGAGDSGFR